MTDLRTPPKRTLPPDLDDEEEVDLGRYGRAIAARWWLLLAGIVAGILIGYLVSLGSGSVWEAQALVYMGTPLAAGGTNFVPGPQTSPQGVNQIVRSEAAVTAAAARCGLRPGQIRGGISSKAVAAGKGTARAGGGQFFQIKVQGDGPRKSACPANVLAQRVVMDNAPYVNTKIQQLEAKLKTDTATITSLDQLIQTYRSEVNNSANLSDVDRLILSSQLNNLQLQRAQLVNEQGDTQQQLAQARFIERPLVFERAVAKKTTARSPRNAMLVGAIIGLLLGLIAALVWDRLPAGALRRNG
jgi:uncharacterized protein involved in exopolysaccharide biosynthesis